MEISNSIFQKHYKLHKPYGYLSQFINNQTKRKNKLLLGGLFDFHNNTMAIGRLDEKSEGLLLLTTNGKLSDYINSSKVEKEYYVQVDGNITDEAIEELRKGVTINIKGEFYTTKPCTIKRINSIVDYPIGYRKIRDERHGPTSWISIILNEGKFRQIRKMTSKVNFPTLRLVRVRIGSILLDLNSGNATEVTTFDI